MIFETAEIRVEEFRNLKQFRLLANALADAGRRDSISSPDLCHFQMEVLRDFWPHSCLLPPVPVPMCVHTACTRPEEMARVKHLSIGNAQTVPNPACNIYVAMTEGNRQAT